MTTCTKCKLPLPEPPPFDAAGEPACWAHRAPERTQDAISVLLLALGFDAMARDCRTETDPARLSHYARIILTQSAPQFRLPLRERFHALHLL